MQAALDKNHPPSGEPVHADQIEARNAIFFVESATLRKLAGIVKMACQIMKRHSQNHSPEVQREQFADGSAVITYPDGSVLIVESKLAKATVLRESRPVNYNDPPPPQVAIVKK